MTRRAILIGFLFAMLVAVGGHFNDVYMGQTYMVGNFFPIAVVGLLLVLVLVVSPLLYRMRPRFGFTAGELAVIVALPLAVCAVPGSGFLRTFTPTMVLPKHYEKMSQSWQKSEVLAYVPKPLLANATKEKEDEFLGAFLQGKGSVKRHIGLSDIPWQTWRQPLAAWLPLFIVLMVGLMGLSLVLHRQWTSHEHLVYPVAEFVQLVTAKSEGRAFPDVGRNRLFWYGFLPVLIIHAINGLHAWLPTFVAFPHELNLAPLEELFPKIMLCSGGSFVFTSQIYFSVVAFAFFLPSDITLSLGLANLSSVLLSVFFITYGISVKNDWIGDGQIQGLLFGAYLGLLMLLIFSGRKYYGRVLLAAFGKRTQDPPLEPSAIWGFRIFLTALLVVIVLMTRMGLAWPFAVLMALLLVILFTGMTRICAETGLFFVQPGWQAVGVVLGICGAAAVGPQMLVIMALICVVISIDPRECMMPFVANALRIAENAGVKRGRLAGLMGFTFLIGLLAGLVVVLWLQYDRGVGLRDSWATQSVPRMGFNFADNHIQQMKAEGLLTRTAGMNWSQRLDFLHPNAGYLKFLFSGFAVFAACAFLRLRFPKWPLHPVLFLVWFTYPLMCFSASFLIGWAVKSMIVKFGGGGTHQRLKPLMVGLIAGDLTGGLIFMIVGGLYYFITGFPPHNFSIFPG